MTIAAEQLTKISAGASKPVGGQHIRALDGIRGVAILLVLAYHLVTSINVEFGLGNPVLMASQLGWVGVDLFFVLSGFLITGILYDSKGSARYFKNFYSRRALRIFPLYFSTLLFVLLLTKVLPISELHGNSNQLWLWVYMSNFVMAFQGSGSFGLLDHFWSLAIEEQFYLVWPLLVFLLSRRQLIFVATGMCLVALMLRIGFVLATDNTLAPYVLTPARMDSLAAGALVALAIRGPNAIALEQLVRPAGLAVAFSVMGLVVILVVTRSTSAESTLMQSAGHSLLALLFAATIVLGIASPLRWLFNHPVLRWFGKYSYGLYVWHPIVWMILFHSAWARGLRGGNGMTEMAVSVVVALVTVVVIALLSWELMESRFLRLKRFFQ